MLTIKPKFTILIPCKDRAHFLYQTLRTCSNQSYENLEILVADDGSSDNTKDVVENFSKMDSRIKYITIEEGKTFGMSKNFEFALNQVDEGYVICLGGDDALLPDGIENISKIINKTNCKILTWSNATFIYPNEYIPNGQLIMKGSYGSLSNNLSSVNSTNYLKRQAKNLNYVHDIEAPMMYVKSAISIDLIKKVKSRSSNGRFFSCSVPDGYSGIVLAGEVENYLFSDEPFSMHGVSKLSAGWNYMTESKEARKISKSFIELAKSQPMHEKLASIPYTPLIPTMTADFLLTAKDLPGWQGDFGEIDFKKLVNRALDEMSSGQLPYSSLNRELFLLRQIAKYHGIEKYFYKKLKDVRRNAKNNLRGSALSPSQIYFDGKDYGIKNVFDAGYFVQNMFSLSKNRNFKNFLKIANNSVRHKLKEYNKKGTLPDETEWSL